MFRKILIANRGEIAVRIIRTCRELGIKTVAVFSEADREALHVKMADEAHCVGPSPSSKSYLRVFNIIEAAVKTGVDAIHPGYGFLAENADFAQLCADYGLVFIGPSPGAITKMGEKSIARKTMFTAGVPIVPGTDGVVIDLEETIRLAEEIGYPVIVKATAGGGGKGMREASSEDKLKSAIKIAKQEALTSFGNAEVYMEKLIEEPRHVEFQIMADKYGNVVHFGERDCSIQRRHQKLIEESPSPALDEKTRSAMGEAAVKAVKAIDYCGAGTIEFLLDKYNNYFFIEMNTRIQVEHTVTEEVTGIDLIKEQILVATGQKLSVTQSDIRIQGWAIECRVNAEDPDKEFIPSPGKIDMYLPPGGFGVRVDSAAYTGYTITPYYDSMVAKLIVKANTREEAIERMKRALSEFIVSGVSTTIPFHLRVMNNSEFKQGNFNTGFLYSIKEE